MTDNGTTTTHHFYAEYPLDDPNQWARDLTRQEVIHEICTWLRTHGYANLATIVKAAGERQ
jgi:hypothetical protein